MHKLILMTGCVALTALVISCTNEILCTGGSHVSTGIITASPDILCPVKGSGSNFVIRSEDVYIQTFDTSGVPVSCDLPAIDFSESTLLGLFAQGTCEVNFTRDVVRIEDENRYHYSVTVGECGDCEKLTSSYNWVVVPILPEGWVVSFEVL